MIQAPPTEPEPSDANARVVIYGPGDVVVYDRILLEPPSIPVLREIREKVREALR